MKPQCPDWFQLSAVREKVRSLPEALTEALAQTSARHSFDALGRDVRVVPVAKLPPKPGIATREGQARLLHDLASIELQAMELGMRTLCEFPEAPSEFRKELSEITLGEGRHLELCLNGLEALGYEWGHWDVHVSLWNTVGPEDRLLDRILIVHRYLEGSGLDAGDSILRRLNSVAALGPREIVSLIVREEVDHVQFGSRWYRRIAEMEHIDPEVDFVARIGQIARLAPRRERLARELRLKAGFSEAELAALDSCLPGGKRGESR